MFTEQFKMTVLMLVIILAVGGIVFNQLRLQQEVNALSEKPVSIEKIMVTPTQVPVTPTASPTATLKKAVLPVTKTSVTKTKEPVTTVTP